MLRKPAVIALLLLLLCGPVHGIPVRRAVVVGGGPGGLAAAITLRQLGVEVTVLEARNENYQRMFHLALRPDTVQALDQMGVLETLALPSGYTTAEVSELRTAYPATREAPEMLADVSPFVVRINDLEKTLQQRAVELGVDYRPDTTMSYDHWPELWAQPGKMEVAGGFHPEGEATFLGQVDLLVAAEGIRSPLRSQLGITFKPESGYTWFTGLLFPQPSPTRFRRWLRSKPEGFEQHVIALGHKAYPDTWCLIELEPKAAYLSREERTAYACRQVGELFGIPLQPEQLLWGGLFSKVQKRRAERVVEKVGDLHCAIVGEAARAGYAWSSCGANLALVCDPRSLARLVESLREDQPEALATFEREIQSSSDAWLKQDLKEFSEGLEP